MAWQYRVQNALSGASSGAGLGATIGSVIPGVGTGVGTGVGAGIGALIGLLSPTEQQELADRYARGEIDPDTQRAIESMLADRFDAIRREQGGRLGRAGLQDSSIAERIMADTYDSERQALADAFANTAFARQQYGMQLLNQQGAQQGAALSTAVQTLGNLYTEGQNQAFREKLLAAMNTPAAAPQAPTSVYTPIPETSVYGSRRTMPQIGIASMPGFTNWKDRAMQNYASSITQSNQGAGYRGASPNIMNSGYERKYF